MLGKVFADHLQDNVLVVNKFERLETGEVGMEVLKKKTCLVLLRLQLRSRDEIVRYS